MNFNANTRLCPFKQLDTDLLKKNFKKTNTYEYLPFYSYGMKQGRSNFTPKTTAINRFSVFNL